MKKILIIVSILIMATACGKKGDPYPKSSLDIPLPDNVQIELNEDGVHITNSFSENTILAERAISGSEDFFSSSPHFRTLAEISPRQTYIDNTTEANTQYIYRFATYHNRYDALSPYVTQMVSYRGTINVEDVSWRLEDDNLCIDATPSRSTAYTQIIINGNNMGRYNPLSPCFTAPPTPSILFAVIPYSESGNAGASVSQNIIRDMNSTLLPPLNIRILRRATQTTLSWDIVPVADKYRIYVLNPDGTETIYEQDTTIFNSPSYPDRCSNFRLSSISNGRESAIVGAESCP